MTRSVILLSLILIFICMLLPLFSFFPYHYSYIDHLPAIETYKTGTGYSNGIIIDDGCVNICLRFNLLDDIQYVELYRDSIKFFRIEYDPFTTHADDDYVKYSLVNSDLTSISIDRTSSRTPWWGHLKTGEWVPLPGIISEKNKHMFDMQLVLTLAQVQKNDNKKVSGVVGITIEPLPDISYTNQAKLVGLQKHHPWKFTARTDKGVVNIADEVVVQDSHWSLGK